MIGKTISHYKIIEKLGEALLRLSFVRHGGLAPAYRTGSRRSNIYLILGDTL